MAALGPEYTVPPRLQLAVAPVQNEAQFEAAVGIMNTATLFRGNGPNDPWEKREAHAFHQDYHLGKEVNAGGYGLVWTCQTVANRANPAQPTHDRAVKIFRKCHGTIPATYATNLPGTTTYDRFGVAGFDAATVYNNTAPNLLRLGNTLTTHEPNSYRQWLRRADITQKEMAIMKTLFQARLNDNNADFLGSEIIAIYEDQYLLFWVMPRYVCDLNPSHCIPDFISTLPDVKRVVYQLLQGLSAMHALNLVHMDLKPGNVCIDLQKNVKIIDFGLTLDTANATENSWFGTWIYLPPESYRRFAADIAADPNADPNEPARPVPNGKSDVWSAGCILFELLMNDFMWQHENLRLGMRHEVQTEDDFGMLRTREETVEMPIDAAVPLQPRGYFGTPRGHADRLRHQNELNICRDAILALCDPDPATRPTSAQCLRNDAQNPAQLFRDNNALAGQPTLADPAAWTYTHKGYEGDKKQVGGDLSWSSQEDTSGEYSQVAVAEDGRERRRWRPVAAPRRGERQWKHRRDMARAARARPRLPPGHPAAREHERLRRENRQLRRKLRCLRKAADVVVQRV